MYAWKDKYTWKDVVETLQNLLSEYNQYEPPVDAVAIDSAIATANMLEKFGCKPPRYTYWSEEEVGVIFEWSGEGCENYMEIQISNEIEHIIRYDPCRRR